MSFAIIAADRGPAVTIQSSKNYKIVVDGKSYFGSAATLRLSNLSQGIHTIRVYEMRRGVFARGEQLVSSSSFKLGKRDVVIKVDHRGRIDISRVKGNNRFDRDRRNWNKRDRSKFQHDKKMRDVPVRRF